jgi:uncharacterized membrane protein YoaK (UPF0700 family)
VSERERALLLALVALTFVTGLVDATSYIGLGHVFTANMTGNIVLLGFAVARTHGFSAAPLLASLGGFVLGAALAGRLVLAQLDRAEHRLRAAIALEVAFVAAAAGAAAGLHPGTADGRRYLVIALLGIAMGLRNAVVRGLQVPDMTTTVLTMTMTGLAVDSPLGGQPTRHPRRRIASVVAMGLGALVGALLVRHSLVLPLAVTAGLSLAILAGFHAYTGTG